MNHCWGFSGHRRFPKKRLLEFREEVKEALKDCPKVNRFCKLEVKFYVPDRRKRDVSNPEKPLLDAMENAELFADDYQVDDTRYYRARDKEGNILITDKGATVITIEETYDNYNFKKISREDMEDIEDAY